MGTAGSVVQRLVVLGFYLIFGLALVVSRLQPTPHSWLYMKRVPRTR